MSCQGEGHGHSHGVCQEPAGHAGTLFVLLGRDKTKLKN